MPDAAIIVQFLKDWIVGLLCLIGILTIIVKFADWKTKLQIEADKNNKRIEYGIWQVSLFALAASLVSLGLSVIALLR